MNLFVVVGTGLRLPAAVGRMAGTETGSSRVDSAGASVGADPLFSNDPWAHATGTPVSFAPPFGPPMHGAGSQCPIPPPWQQTEGETLPMPNSTGQASEQSWQCVVSETLPVAVGSEQTGWNPHFVASHPASLSGVAGSTSPSMPCSGSMHGLGHVAPPPGFPQMSSHPCHPFGSHQPHVHPSAFPGGCRGPQGFPFCGGCCGQNPQHPNEWWPYLWGAPHIPVGHVPPGWTMSPTSPSFVPPGLKDEDGKTKPSKDYGRPGKTSKESSKEKVKKSLDEDAEGRRPDGVRAKARLGPPIG